MIILKKSEYKLNYSETQNNKKLTTQVQELLRKVCHFRLTRFRSTLANFAGFQRKNYTLSHILTILIVRF